MSQELPDGVELPPLPEYSDGVLAPHEGSATSVVYGYHEGTLKAYATAAILAYREKQAARVPATQYCWLVENGKQAGQGLAYRTMEHGWPEWTEDPHKAIRFSRRADAEMFAQEDDDAWRIVEHGFESPEAAPTTEPSKAEQADAPSGIHVCSRHDFHIVTDPKAGCEFCNAERATQPPASNAGEREALALDIKSAIAELASGAVYPDLLEAIDKLTAIAAQPQPCGHPASLLLTSAETGERLYCEACDDKSGRRDAEARESELMAANRVLLAELADLKKRDERRAEITSEEWEWLKHPQSAKDLADFVYEFAARNVATKPQAEDVLGAVLVDRESREGVAFYSTDMIPDPSTIKDRFELVEVVRAARTRGEGSGA